MYRHDVPIIARHAWGSPAGLFDVIEFVLLTIQQPLQYIARQRTDIRETGAGSVYLFGSKRAGWRWAEENLEELWGEARRIILSPSDPTVPLIEHFLQVPGLGMIKAAFVVQCLGYDASCLDRHNAQRLGIPEASLKLNMKLRPETIRSKVAAYVELCRSTGGAEFWWDTWCSHVAGRRGSPLATPEEVSRYHTDTILMTAWAPLALAS